MANLSDAQAIALIKEPKNSREIQRAKRKRIRHKLHTEPDTDTFDASLGEWHQIFLMWVRDLLQSEDNYNRFRQLYRPPVATNELVESIFSEFEKVFEAKNSFEKFEFTDDQLVNDFNDYRRKIGDYSFWETQGFETFKNSIDNILIVDMPQIDAPDNDGDAPQLTAEPEPYYYLLDINYLIDIENERVKGTDSLSGAPLYFFKTEYIIFKDCDGFVYVFDDTFYRRFVCVEGSDEYKMDVKVAHNLGFCPARSFWTTPLNSTSNIQKRNPITNSISELDWLLFFTIAQKYLELYAPFPIYAVYKPKCSYTEKGRDNITWKCEDGYLTYPNMVMGAGVPRRACPSCSKKLKVGPGNIMLIDVPREKSEDYDMMTNPMKVIPAEETSLKYVKEAIEAKRNEIYANCVGREMDPGNQQAKNEMQIQAGFESKQSVLTKVKRNFEIIHAWALDTIARLRYGDRFISATVDYGDDFFLQDEDEEMADYKEAVANGLPNYELAARRQAIYESRYKNDPDLLERLRIMRNLEPFPDMTVQTLQELRVKTPELVPLSDLVLKINFNNFIDRFEREQSNIIQFGSALQFDKKIASIRTILDSYSTEQITKGKEDAPAPTPAPVPNPNPFLGSGAAGSGSGSGAGAAA